MGFLQCMSDAVMDRSPEQLIEALLAATAIAFLVASIYAVGSRKARPTPSFVGMLSLCGCAASMLVTASGILYLGTNWPLPAHVHHAGSPIHPAAAGSASRGGEPWNDPGPVMSTGAHVMIAADANRDGKLSREELDCLLREADFDGDGSVALREIDRLVVSRMVPPHARRGSDPRAHERDAP